METRTKEEDSRDLSQPQTLSETAPITDSQPAPPTEGAPDPDEDDLDDLDDMLDEFSATTLKTTAAPPPSSAQEPKAPDQQGLADDDFAKQLQAGMAELIGEIDKSPAMKAEFEAMMKELNSASTLDGTGPSPPPSASNAGAAADESFQETIQKTMERMQASGDKATAAAAAEDGSEDFLAEMLRQMQSGDGGGSEEDFSKMLMGMMEQLTNKDILYEPMKELDAKFPAWLARNRERTAAGDWERYALQQTLVRDIVRKFEEPAYSDENVAMREFIVERMQKMQAAGSPPEDLVGDMATAQEAFGHADEGCPTQ